MDLPIGPCTTIDYRHEPNSNTIPAILGCLPAAKEGNEINRCMMGLMGVKQTKEEGMRVQNAKRERKCECQRRGKKELT